MPTVITPATRQCARRSSKPRAKGEASPGRSVAREPAEGEERRQSQLQVTSHQFIQYGIV